MTELTEIISDQQKLENPGDYPLLSVLMSYYDLREKERWNWSNGARNKGGINDLKEKATVLCFMKDHDIYSIKDFARLLNTTSGKVREMESDKKAKEKRIRDIDAILDAVKTLKELNPIREKYNGIHFTKSKEKYRQEHADETPGHEIKHLLLRIAEILGNDACGNDGVVIGHLRGVEHTL